MSSYIIATSLEELVFKQWTVVSGSLSVFDVYFEESDGWNKIQGYGIL